MSTARTKRKASAQTTARGLKEGADGVNAPTGKAPKPRSSSQGGTADVDTASPVHGRKRTTAAPTDLIADDGQGTEDHRTTLQDGAVVNTERWHRLVAEAAYYRAERRGFENGSPEQDWLEAEEELRRTWSEGRV